MEIRVFNVVSSSLGRREILFGYQLPGMPVALKLESLEYLARGIKSEIAAIARTDGKQSVEVVFQSDVTRVSPVCLPEECHYPLSLEEEREVRRILNAVSL